MSSPSLRLSNYFLIFISLGEGFSFNVPFYLSFSLSFFFLSFHSLSIALQNLAFKKY